MVPPDTFLCWCFEHTAAAIQSEVRATGDSAIARDVRARVRAGDCDCARLNPTGRCCLGDIARAIRDAMEER